MIPAAEDPVDPREHDVSVVISMDRSQRQYANSTNEYRRLHQILPRYPTLDVLPYHQKTERHAANRPAQSQIRLQQDHHVSQSFLFDLVRL